ncbi:MAG: DUF2442 domain-containing protein [Anaerolineae bacterium]
MEHKIYRVVSFELAGRYTLKITFDDGVTQVINFQPVLAGEIYGPLQEEKFFNQVEIDPEVHTLVWPNGADFDPATLHDWNKYVDDLKRMAERWRKVAA